MLASLTLVTGITKVLLAEVVGTSGASGIVAAGARHVKPGLSAHWKELAEEGDQGAANMGSRALFLKPEDVDEEEDRREEDEEEGRVLPKVFGARKEAIARYEARSETEVGLWWGWLNLKLEFDSKKKLGKMPS